ncbi:MAG: MBL fold metallo-hydrolase [Bacillota bacterium]
MKITILGCYAPYAPAGGACSGYLFQMENFNLMVDCGHGAFAQLQNHINFRELHTLVITHFHPDHYADIHAARHAFAGAIRDGSRSDPLIVYAPTEPSHIYQEISQWRDVFITIPLEDAMLRKNKFGRVKVDFFPTEHTLPTFGTRIIDGNKVVVYTSDTAWTTNLADECQGSNILITEASLREADIAHTIKGHMTAQQAGLLAQKSDSGRLLLTHFWPEYNLYQLKREAEVNYEGEVELAQVGASFIL